MAHKNKHGLARTIPEDVKRQVRKKSKFGCVFCRKGFYQYEHIDPTFENALEHNADHICCLCGGCHDAVTRGQISKAAVLKAYNEIKNNECDVLPPVGPLDFHDGQAELVIGGLTYSPVVNNVLTYYGKNIITVHPGKTKDEPGKISAIFTNDEGEEVFQLKENEWIGDINNWDIEVVATRIIVRRKKGQIIFKLRLDPPGKLIIEYLDMRIGDAHILITDKTYVVGRYVDEESIYGFHSEIRITKSSIDGAAIEFLDPLELQQRSIYLKGLKGHQMMQTENGLFRLILK